ncbi:hypothetical protein [Alicyclobacillus acidoterrestris]|uniref:Uncharacterized protein n=1 Tax=Alicyclobacillus acidoterrestris (strain ATCC 49025 / DSM 3922 / CIP 106132 / NCIMB 13137 / GD3B) TaxID=1356854 RepID=T0D3Z4_ALIAG|nr:hypothetical protein [Alicyclobacillus acidoterrestris]EPZ44471.1 hypothetical protein N007_10935 [Alicyclobacillus acidoterrestris ATCC 49025]UNO49356.1 hypothetical protein K1I37_02020 [Alicyclobacillus acidoterrestris]
MSLKGSEREFIFSLYLKEHKSLLEDVVGRGLTDLLLESYWQGYKLDLVGYDKVMGTPTVAELWLGTSDSYHQERLLSLIDALDEGAMLLYLALGFQVTHVRELEQQVGSSGKPIKLLLVRIKDEIMEPLEKLNSMHKLKIYGSLGLLGEVPNLLRVVKTIEHPLYKQLSPKPVPNSQEFDFTKRVDVNRYLLYRLREAVPNFLTLQREKHFVEDNATIILGGGRTGIQFYISARNRRNQAFVQLRFDESNTELFHLFAAKPWLLREKIDERIKAQDNTIGCYFKAFDTVEATVDELAQVFSRMIKHISYPLFDILQYENQMV